MMLRKVLPIALLGLALVGCGVSERRLQAIHKGMTPEEVLRTLGVSKPEARNFNPRGEEWLFSNTNVWGTSVYRIYFENGRVVAFDDGSARRSMPIAEPSISIGGVSIGGGGIGVGGGIQIPLPTGRQRRDYDRVQAESDRSVWLTRFVKEMREHRLQAETQYQIIRRQLASRVITPGEAAQVLETLAFASEQWQALELMLPAFADFEDMTSLYKIFPYISDAERINKMINTEIERRKAWRGY